MPAVHRLLPVLLLSSFAAGCASVAAVPPTPAPEAPSETPSETPVAAPLQADWTDGSVVLTLDNGWFVRRCDGAAPLLCVVDGDRVVGDVELGQYPAGEDVLTADDLVTSLFDQARGFLAAMEEDRAAGCPDFSFQSIAPTNAVVDGGPAVRTGFTLRDDAGDEVERLIVHITVQDGTVWWITASAYVEEGGCLPTEQDFDPPTLAAFEPFLDLIVRGTPLPEPDGAEGHLP